MESNRQVDGLGISIKAYEKHRNKIIWTATILSVIVLTFLLFAVNAWTDDCNKLDTTSWANGMQTFVVSGKVIDARLSYGINGFCIQSISPTGNVDVSNSTTVPVWKKWSDCNLNFCHSCTTSVDTVIGLLIVATILIAVVIPLSFMRLQYCGCKDSLCMRYFILFATLLVIIFSLSAYGYWSTQCYKAIDRSKQGYNLTYGTGYGLTIISWFLSFVVFVLHLLKPKGSALHTLASDRARQISQRNLSHQTSARDVKIDNTKNVLLDVSATRS